MRRQELLYDTREPKVLKTLAALRGSASRNRNNNPSPNNNNNNSNNASTSGSVLKKDYIRLERINQGIKRNYDQSKIGGEKMFKLLT